MPAVAPGPKGHFLLGSMGEFARDPLGAVGRWAREYGDVVGFRFVRTPCVLLNRPEHIEYVLGTHYRDFIKTIGLRTPMMRMFLGSGLLTSEGEFWVRQRRLAQPAFHRERIAAYARQMIACADRGLAGWREGETRDIHQEMTHLTLDIVVRTLFGVEVGDQAARVRQALEVIIAEFGTQQWSLRAYLQGIPLTAGYRRVQRAVRELDEILFGIIRRRRESEEEGHDLLSMLLQARDEDGSRMDDRQLRDEAMTLFLAGHETTALALSWAWYLLAEHPAAARRLQHEVDTVLEGRSPGFEDLARLPYTERVIRESMRLYPPVWMMGRTALKEFEVEGYRIPAQAEVMVSPWLTHRDPRHFNRPEEFRPERWEDDLAKRLPRCVYFPFGGGPRSCIGSTFAMMEAVLVLARIAQEVEFNLAPGQEIAPWPTMGLRPRDGVRAVIRLRTAAGRPFDRREAAALTS